LTTFLITISCGAWSSLVTVQVFDAPGAIAPEQSLEYDAAYPLGPDSATL